MTDFSARASVKIDGRGGRYLYAQADELRAAGPAVAVELPDGRPAWSVSRGEVVRFLSAHPGVSGHVAPGPEPITPPRPDVATLLDELAAQPADEPIDLRATYSRRLPVTAGFGSRATVALINHTIRELLANPDQLATLITQPNRWPDALEESLRVHCPVASVLRRAEEDIDLGDGVTVRAGEAILLNHLAHGRDPNVHEDPEIFDIDRASKEHLAFGVGPHSCPAADRALLEAEVAIRILLDRFPRLHLAVPPERIPPLPSFTINDVATLPVLLRHRLAKAA
ncbi:cytochrome P450 [Actinophytocola sp.]|uniref:cytochrome P450 n=1 Tax=Actinophytocola sp. TaxID=1872138 RepID=UPI003899DBAC